MECLLCRQPLRWELRLAELVTLKALVAPRLCASCLRTFERIDQELACPGCGRANSPQLCLDCQRWQAQGEALLHHRAVFTYNQAMKAFIQQYKGLGDWRLHVAFQTELQPPQHGVLVPIPSEAGHYARRGFDPVLGLFGHLPLRQWLTKADTAQPQAQKNRAGRLATPQSFSLKPEADFRRVSRVILVDDLYTTGRTLYHAAHALKAGGFCGKITSFSLIR
ncbi:ComF family protein [Lacticaseibacillus sp. GG6-2]